MKIIITIDENKFEGSREADKIIAQMHEDLLGEVDENTDVQYEYDADTKEDDSTYEDDLRDDFINDELEDVTEFKKLVWNSTVLKKIKQILEGDAMGSSGRSHLSGSYAQIDSISAVKYKEGKVWKIRIFAHVETGLQDENGTTSENWNTSSLWTIKGEFIELYD